MKKKVKRTYNQKSSTVANQQQRFGYCIIKRQIHLRQTLDNRHSMLLAAACIQVDQLATRKARVSATAPVKANGQAFVERSVFSKHMWLRVSAILTLVQLSVSLYICVYVCVSVWQCLHSTAI